MSFLCLCLKRNTNLSVFSKRIRDRDSLEIPSSISADSFSDNTTIIERNPWYTRKVCIHSEACSSFLFTCCVEQLLRLLGPHPILSN